MLNYLPVTLYKKPDGRKQIIEVRNINSSDLEYFTSNNIKVSMEEFDENNYIVYACPKDDLTEESEVIVFSNGRSCEETLAELVELCKAETW